MEWVLHRALVRGQGRGKARGLQRYENRDRVREGLRKRGQLGLVEGNKKRKSGGYYELLSSHAKSGRHMRAQISTEVFIWIRGPTYSRGITLQEHE